MAHQTMMMAFDIGIHHFAWAKMRTFSHISKVSELVSMDCHDFGSNLKTVDLYPLLLKYLQSLDYLGVHTVLIEQQMNRMNIRATKVAVFVYAFFLMQHPCINVLEYPSYHKTKAFGVHGLSKPERKKWTVQHVTDFVLKDDPVALDWLDQFPKKDDICDCVMMMESFRKK